MAYARTKNVRVIQALEAAINGITDRKPEELDRLWRAYQDIEITILGLEQHVEDFLRNVDSVEQSRIALRKAISWVPND